MKEILESILKVEEDSAARSRDSQAKAQEILSAARHDADEMEKRMETDFQNERENRRESILKEAEAYTQKLQADACDHGDMKKKQLEAGAESIRRKAIALVLGE
jgi:vacuolar-type H+-ATPase subunit E/Vma4